MWNKNVQDWWRRPSTKPQTQAGSKACDEKEAEQESKTKEKIVFMVAEDPYLLETAT
jgi:hypothetical protein